MVKINGLFKSKFYRKKLNRITQTKTKKQKDNGTICCNRNLRFPSPMVNKFKSSNFVLLLDADLQQVMQPEFHLHVCSPSWDMTKKHPLASLNGRGLQHKKLLIRKKG